LWDTTLAVLTSSVAWASPVFQLSNVKLDGDPNENTFGFANNGSTGSASFTYSGGNLSIVADAGRVAYVVSYFAPQTLTKIHDKITFSFTARITGVPTGDGTLRLGLFDSGNSKATSNSFTNTDASSLGSSAFSANRGYAAYYREDTNNPSASNKIYQRTASSNNILGSGSMTSLGTSTLGKLSLAANTDFSGTFSIEKTATGSLVTTSVKGVGDFVTDTDSPFTTFDTLALFSYAPGSASSTLSISSLSIIVVPEPQVAQLALAGLASTGLMVRPRRR